VTLLSRTTRSVALTAAGRRLFEQAVGDESGAGSDQGSIGPRGRDHRADRITAPALAVPFVINPVLPRFVALHPKVEVEVQVDNRLVDIVAEGFDAGVRLEEFLERDMVHVRLTEPFRFVVVGAPSYLQRRARPTSPGTCSRTIASTSDRHHGRDVRLELERGRRPGASRCVDR